MDNRYLQKTRMLNYESDRIRALVKAHKWDALDEYQKIGAVYDFVRNDILFGYNRSDLLFLRGSHEGGADPHDQNCKEK